jgi:hypothetical protein
VSDPKCKSCGVPFVDHLGLIGTCAKLQAAADNPDFDFTDAAHPAWWRGNDAAVESLCRIINDIFDGKHGDGGTASEPWESVRKRLFALRETHAALQAALAEATRLKALNEQMAIRIAAQSELLSRRAERVDQ